MRNGRTPRIAADGLLSSMDLTAKEPESSLGVESNETFLVRHLVEKGVELRPALKRRRVAVYASPRAERERQEAEAAARTIMRHRVAANERRYPEIFAQLRAPGFAEWYAGATKGEQWNPEWEADIDEIRFHILLAHEREKAGV
ncbi:hypothetical protein [Burkholderia plantarii]|uniref:hypothetical protein n=1 Tax=Burkholderia plantarii TaxID=41899 RepID=UPI000870A8BE|nr:hypothetical protein [Burkholderia plantarii]